MKTKKRRIKTSKDPEVLDYCKACLSIRSGMYLSEKNSFPHTCRKSGKEIDELIFHTNIIIGLRGKEFFESMYLW